MEDIRKEIKFFMSPPPFGREVWSQQLTMNYIGITSGNMRMIRLKNS
jgi:hypothetical protein